MHFKIEERRLVRNEINDPRTTVLKFKDNRKSRSSLVDAVVIPAPREKNKVAAIFGALTGGLVDVLVTDA